MFLLFSTKCPPAQMVSISNDSGKAVRYTVYVMYSVRRIRNGKKTNEYKGTEMERAACLVSLILVLLLPCAQTPPATRSQLPLIMIIIIIIAQGTLYVYSLQCRLSVSTVLLVCECVLWARKDMEDVKHYDFMIVKTVNFHTEK